MPKLIVVIGGVAGAGKDTFAGMMAKHLDKLSVSSRLDAYAWTLKQIVHLKYGIPLNILHADKAVKESTFFYGKTVRQLLQYEGQLARETCGATIWADRVVDRVRAQQEQVAIITDARHPKEEIIDMRERVEGSRVFVMRVTNPRVPIIRGHPSEDLIADAPDDIFDFLVENVGSLGDLAVQAADHVAAMLLLDQTGAKHISSRLVAHSVSADGWPYPSEEDAKVLAASVPGAMLTRRTFTHLRGPIVRG